jgi:hypothetical protein
MSKIFLFIISLTIANEALACWGTSNDDEKASKGIINRFVEFKDNKTYIENGSKLDPLGTILSNGGGLATLDVHYENDLHRRVLRNEIRKNPDSEGYIRRRYKEAHEEKLKEENEGFMWIPNGITRALNAAGDNVKKAAAGYVLIKGAEKVAGKSS